MTYVCSICLGEMALSRDIVTTSCQHVFHKACLETWLETRSQAKACPKCFSSLLDEGAIRQLFLDENSDDEDLADSDEYERTEYLTLENLSMALMQAKPGAMSAKRVRTKCGLSLRELDGYLLKYPGILVNHTIVAEEDDKHRPTRPDDIIGIHPFEVKLCVRYNSKGGCQRDKCRKLHFLMRDFVRRTLSRRRMKKWSDLKAKHNRSALKRLLGMDEVSKLSPIFVFRLLKFRLLKESDESDEEDTDDGSKSGSEDDEDATTDCESVKAESGSDSDWEEEDRRRKRRRTRVPRVQFGSSDDDDDGD